MLTVHIYIYIELYRHILYTCLEENQTYALHIQYKAEHNQELHTIRQHTVNYSICLTVRSRYNTMVQLHLFESLFFSG